jgi:hypothetical protein
MAVHGSSLGLPGLPTTLERREMTQAQTRHPRFETPSGAPEEYAGYEVRDPTGHRIGRAEKLFFNENGGVEYIRLGVGLLSKKLVLIPVRDVALDRAARSLTLKP